MNAWLENQPVPEVGKGVRRSSNNGRRWQVKVTGGVWEMVHDLQFNVCLR